MKTRRSSSGSQLLAGYLGCLGSIVTSVLSACCVQALRGAIPDFELSAIRSIGQCLSYLIGGLIVSTDFRVGNQYIAWLMYYGSLFLLNNVGFYGAATYLPLGEVQGCVTIVSFLFTLAQSKLLFNFDIAKSIVMATLVCVVGIVLTVQPVWLFHKMGPTEITGTTAFTNMSSTFESLSPPRNYGYSVSSGKVMVGYTLTVFGGAGLGLGYDLNGLILHEIDIFPKAMYATLLCTIGSTILMFYLEEPVFAISFIQLVYALGHALLSAITSFLTMYASNIVPGPSLSIMYSFELVTMLTAQYTIMHSIQPGNYNWLEVCGCIIVLCGASIPGIMDILAHRGKANELP